MTHRFSPGQRAAIYEAREDYRHARLANRRVDVVDIATETANYWWTRLGDRGTRIAGRFITWAIPPLSEDAAGADILALCKRAAAGDQQARETLYDAH